MKDFVVWLTTRRYRMVLLASALLLAAVALPLLSPLLVVAQAVIVLAVLTRGANEGALIAMMAVALLVLPRILIGSGATTMLSFAVANWLPPLILAMLLERTQSLSLTTQVATVLVAAVMVLVFAVTSPMTAWSDLLNESIARYGDRIGEVSPEDVTGVSQLLTRLFGSAILLTSMCAVYLGRWWQASVSNPGAFGREFRSLRLGIVVGALAGAIFVVAGLTRIALLENLALVMLTGFLFHGLAVIHSIAAAGTGGLWLVAVYALMITLPFAAVPVAGLGFIDNWFDLRSRLAGRRP